MDSNRDQKSDEEIMPTAEEIEAALGAFRRGSPEEFDRLLGDHEPRICRLLAALLEALSRR